METKEKKAPAKTVAKEIKKDTWEIKDRYYHLMHSKSPLTFRINSKHSARKPLMYFDEAKGYNRELRYATNMKSPFVDEQVGSVTLGHIVFEDGVLMVWSCDEKACTPLKCEKKELKEIETEISKYQITKLQVWVENNMLSLLKGDSRLPFLVYKISLLGRYFNGDFGFPELIGLIQKSMGGFYETSKRNPISVFKIRTVQARKIGCFISAYE